MNYTTRIILTTALAVLFALPASGAEMFYDDYSESERLVIAGAYLAVSEHYDALGEDKKAEEYKSMADLIFPGIDSIPPAETKSGNEAEQTTVSAPVVRPSGKEPAAVQYYFGKLMRGVFTENERDILPLLSTRLFLPGYDEGVRKEEVAAYIRRAFEEYPIDETDPSAIYRLERIFIRSEGSAWIASIKVTPLGERLFASAGFPGETQNFYFREYREGWRLIAVSAE